MGFLIDTCIWIDVEQGALAPADVAMVTREEPVYLSPVTIAELAFGAETAPDPGIRERRRAALRRLQRKPHLGIDGGTGEIFGHLAAQVKANGRSHRYRVQDLWLASQAVQHGFRLLTRNKKDFEDIPGLDLVVI
ncbi:MAG: type II toxin-antitoxin system VapC family toxin [Desulfobacteraceae bacterium]|nr:type II toxin-antitoxin system VapC family toxin [Desulfobacteraceae bacterium]